MPTNGAISTFHEFADPLEGECSDLKWGKQLNESAWDSTAEQTPPHWICIFQVSSLVWPKGASLRKLACVTFSARGAL